MLLSTNTDAVDLAWCVIKDVEVIELNKRASGQAFEVILKPPSFDGLPELNASMPQRRDPSLEEIQKKLEAAEERRKVRERARHLTARKHPLFVARSAIVKHLLALFVWFIAETEIGLKWMKGKWEGILEWTERKKELSWGRWKEADERAGTILWGHKDNDPYSSIREDDGARARDKQGKGEESEKIVRDGRALSGNKASPISLDLLAHSDLMY